MNFDISGAEIFSRIPTHLPLIGNIVVSETVVVSWLMMLIIMELCAFLTRDLKMEHIGKRQVLIELIVESAESLVRDNTGGNKLDYLIPPVGVLFSTSVISNLISLVELRSPTADLSVEAAWAVTIFTVITLNKIRAGGLLGYLRGLTTPISVMTLFNTLSEIVTPVNMACRHFGNVLSDVVISRLIYAVLGTASTALFRLIPGAVGDFLLYTPILTVKLPVIMLFYSNWSSGIVQAFIFTVLTIMYTTDASEG